MIITTSNIQGLNSPAKQKGVQSLVRKHSIDVLGLVETKFNLVNASFFMKNYFPDWSFSHNFDIAPGGRILLIWDSSKAHVEILERSAQVMHCKLRCTVSHNSFFVSFVYGYWSVTTRRPLWDSLWTFGNPLTLPWMVLGDFNCLLSPDERVNGVPPTEYQINEFVDLCSSLGLVDSVSSGIRFTWTNGRVMSKLDRVLINNEWLEAGWFCKTKFVPCLLSDHAYSVTSLFGINKKVPRPFKFFNMWTSHPKFKLFVQDNWSLPCYGHNQFIFAKRLKAMQAPLKKLNVLEFSDISSRASRAKEELEEAQRALDARPLDLALRQAVASLRPKAVFLVEAERQFLSQKAKYVYLAETDRNSKFFHSLIKRNKTRNTISIIKRLDGSVIDEPDLIPGEFVEFYSSLYGTFVPNQPIDLSVIGEGPCLDRETVSTLVGRVTMLEIREALFDIEDDKSPGPDGFTSAFFK